MIRTVWEQFICGKGERRRYPSAPISCRSEFAHIPLHFSVVPAGPPRATVEGWTHESHCLPTSCKTRPTGHVNEHQEALMTPHITETKSKPSASGRKLWWEVEGGGKDAFRYVHNDIGFQEQLLQHAQLAWHTDWHHEDRWTFHIQRSRALLVTYQAILGPGQTSCWSWAKGNCYWIRLYGPCLLSQKGKLLFPFRLEQPVTKSELSLHWDCSAKEKEWRNRNSVHRSTSPSMARGIWY